MALGYLRPDAVLGGAIRLDRERAVAAIRRGVAEPLGLSLERAAHGIGTLVNLNMANGIRRISIENGYDPRDFALVCAGARRACTSPRWPRKSAAATCWCPRSRPACAPSAR